MSLRLSDEERIVSESHSNLSLPLGEGGGYDWYAAINAWAMVGNLLQISN